LWCVWWGFKGGDALNQPGDDPAGFGVGLALGLQLLSECGYKFGGTVLGYSGALVGVLGATRARLVGA
jgi:hypothetical protein